MSVLQRATWPTIFHHSMVFICKEHAKIKALIKTWNEIRAQTKRQTIWVNKKSQELNYNRPYQPRSSAILKCSNLHSYYKHELGDLQARRERNGQYR